MKRRAAPLLLALAACAPGQADQMAAHDAHRRAEAAVTDALNRPGRPDYPAAIAAVRRGPYAERERLSRTGDLILSACRDGDRYCRAPNDARAGVALLARAAAEESVGGRTSAGRLSAWLARGAGPGLPPDAAHAACWRAVADGRGRKAC